jgi:hypothetical protein
MVIAGIPREEIRHTRAFRTGWPRAAKRAAKRAARKAFRKGGAMRLRP